MKTKKINEVRKQIEYEYKRNSYPDDFPKIPDISGKRYTCLLYTSPSPRDATLSRMPSSA